jgi:lipoprotein-anchoring transpeptidase ErfK/SrfK
MSRHSARRLVTIATLAATLGGVTAASASSSAHHSTTTTSVPALNRAGDAPYGDTLIATLTKSVEAWAGPGTGRHRVISDKWHGNLLATPVIAAQSGYYEIRLPGRPNGSTTWVRQKDVLTSVTPYRIVISIDQTWLKLFKRNQLVMKAPAGVGTKQYPTPTGRFFVAFYAQPPSKGYGPFIMVTSAHSTTITDWEDSGDAMVAIHGPLGSQSQISPHGARVSHGCVRLLLPAQKKLSHVPDGTPVYILSTARR